MIAESLSAAAGEGVDKSKKRKKSAKASPEDGVESVVRADAPDNATQSSQAPKTTAEKGRQGESSSSGPAEQLSRCASSVHICMYMFIVHIGSEGMLTPGDCCDLMWIWAGCSYCACCVQQNLLR